MASEGDEHHHHHHSWWDVFLSFAGEDTRNDFVDHLYSALEKSPILTFKDNEKLERGEPISPTLRKAIEESMVAVVVFSKRYASSRWCLDELVKIMDCYRRCSSSSSCNSSSMGLGPKTVVVIPIFYHVDPSDVRNPIKNGYFGGNIISGQHDPAQVEIWRKALEEAGNLAGHVVNDTINRQEAKFIDTLVKEIWSKLPDIRSSEDEHLVGMEPRIEEVISMLDAKSDAVRFVGIWGLSGIGKTTLAKSIFRRMRNRFKVACFLEQVEVRHGPRHLEKQLVNYLKINNVCEGDKIMSRLRFVNVLLILDDVDGVDNDQLEEFFRKLCLGPGSTILITTRDKHSIDVHGVDEKNTYEAKLLNDGESIQLFRRMAFKRIYPTKEFEHLSYEVIKYADGLPLALKVFGGALCGRNLAFWKASLEKLKKEGPGGDIREKLKIGFDDLDEKVQATFLDIACILEGMEKEHATRILDSFDFVPDHSIQILVDKSLIYVSGGKTLRMHNLIREMGRRIDRKKPRRLWDTKDFECILKCGTDAVNIECILLHPPVLEGKCMEITTEALRKMPKLRLLVVRNVHSRQAPKYLSSKLQWLIWEEFPSESLPPKAYNLVGLELRRSNIKRLWKGKEMMVKLKHIDLSFSPLIESTLDFTSTPNLEVLILHGCKNLKVVHQSLGALERLVRIDVSSCKNLETFPNIIHSKSLQTFRLGGFKKLQNFPEIPVIMENLSDLDLSETGIRELPSPIEHFPNLESLRLIGCKNFAILPGTVGKLKRLTNLCLSGCSELDKLPEELGNLECLKVLYLVGTGIKEVPSSIEHLSGLQELCLSDCKNLRSLPSAICKLKRLSWLDLCGCSELEKLPEELGSLECLSTLRLDGTAITQPPLSVRFLNNLSSLEFSRSSQSRTSVNRKRKRQEDDSTWSLVLPNVLGLRSLRILRLAGCNMLDGAIPSDPESCSLRSLDLGGNCFVQLPSLNQYSELGTLCLDGCKMLEALPELPSSIERLSADDCPSLRLSVDRITNSRILYDVSFNNCLQLLEEYNGESKNEAISTLWQHMIELRHSRIMLPGGDIPKWFVKPTKRGHSISLKLPSNWSTDNFKGFGLCVAFDQTRYKAPFEDGFPPGLCVKIAVSNRQYGVPVQSLNLVTGNTVRTQYGVPLDNYVETGREENISMENMCLKYYSFADLWWGLERTNINDWCEMEVSIKNSSPKTARVTKWGMCLVPKYQTI